MSPSVARFFVSIFLRAVRFSTPLRNAQSSPESSNAGGVSDHDRLLLEKIDRLERRIVELEARAGIDAPAKKPDPAVTTSNVTQGATRGRNAGRKFFQRAN